MLKERNKAELEAVRGEFDDKIAKVAAACRRAVRLLQALTLLRERCQVKSGFAERTRSMAARLAASIKDKVADAVVALSHPW